MARDWRKITRQTLFSGVALAGIGYGFGLAVIEIHRAFSDGAYNPENERVLWQTPLVMATLGVFLTGGLGILLGSARKPLPQMSSPSESA
jgi:hypothetical protein